MTYPMKVTTGTHNMDVTAKYTGTVPSQATEAGSKVREGMP